MIHTVRHGNLTARGHSYGSFAHYTDQRYERHSYHHKPYVRGRPTY